MTIADDTISTDLWADLKTKLVNAGLASSSTSTSDAVVDSASISAQHPDKPGSKPYVVITPPLVDDGGFTFGGTHGSKTINVVIDVVGPKTYMIQQLSDQVRKVLVANDITGVDLVELSEDYAFQMPGGNKYHLKTIVASYQRES